MNRWSILELFHLFLKGRHFILRPIEIILRLIGVETKAVVVTRAGSISFSKSAFELSDFASLRILRLSISTSKAIRISVG